MSDRRPTAEDQRLGDIEGGGQGRDDDDRVGRVTLDEIDWSKAAERRDVLGEWMAKGTTPLPMPKRDRGKDQNPRVPDADSWTDDFPPFPTRIGDWRFLTDYTENNYLKVGYGATTTAPTNFLYRVPRVTIEDKREFGKGINAYVVTENVRRVPAGSAPGEPIVTAEDPETFRERLVLYLDGEQPDEIRHPYYDPALERDLPEGWTYEGMLPTQTKAKHFWGWDPGDERRQEVVSWAILADGYVNGSYSVFAYPPGSSTGSRSPRYFAVDWGVDVLPGDGAAVAAGTARRIMGAINEDPTEPGSDPEPVDAPTDTLKFSFPDVPDREFKNGDRVAVTYMDTQTNGAEQVRGELVDHEFISPTQRDRRQEDYIRYTVEDDSGERFTFENSDVIVDARSRGHTRRPDHGVLRLIERG